MTLFREDTFQDLTRIILENDFLSVAILPELGGKMCSLKFKENDFEYMAVSGRPFRRIEFGGLFGDYDITGFDECFPGIASGFYPEPPWQGTLIPDHGELWAIPWQYEMKKESLHLSVHGIRFPYRFNKIIELTENQVVLRYELTNLSPFLFKFIWSAHPLLKVSEGTTIHLPDNPIIRTDWSKHGRWGNLLYETTWPQAIGPDQKQHDLTCVGPVDRDQATKFFTEPLKEGWCGLHHPKSKNYIGMTFPVDQIPFLGVWINEGGYPFDDQPLHHVALEPCMGCPDKLETAIQRGEYGSINGHERLVWQLTVELGRAEKFPNLIE